MKASDLCTDAACFGKKKDAHGKRLVKEAKAKGHTILEGKKAEEAIRGYGEGAKNLVRADAKNYQDPKSRTNRALVKSAGIDSPVVLAKGPDGELVSRSEADLMDIRNFGQKSIDEVKGKLVELVSKSAVAKALPKKKPSTSGGGAKAAIKVRKDPKMEKARALLGAVVQAAEKHVPGATFWPLLAELVLESDAAGYDAVEQIIARRGIVVDKPAKVKRWAVGVDPEKEALKQALADMTEAQARGLAMELVIASDFTFGHGGHRAPKDALGKSLERAASFYKVDVRKVTAAALVAAKAAEKAKAAEAKAATKKPAKKKKGGRS